MAGRSAGGGSRGGGGRSMGGGSRSGAGRSMGGGASRGSSGSFGGGSRGSSRSFGGGSRGSSGSSSSSGRSMGGRSGSGRSFSSAGPNRHSSSGGSSSNRPTGSTGGFGGGFGAGPLGGHHHHHHHHRPLFRSFGPRIPYYGSFGPGYRRSSPGCLPTLLIVFAIIFIAALFGSNNSNSNSYNNSDTAITSNTVKREPLEKGAVKETAYYEDNLNWINNKTKLQTGLKNFYNLTGIQPFILLVESVGNDPTDEEIDIYANQYYDEHFEDEAHLLFIYIQDIDYMYGIVGTRGKAIMDQEAWDILYDYAENYWNSDLEDEDMFATVFTKAGERIMSDPNAGTKMKTSVVKVLIIVVAIIIIISILRKWQKDRALQKQKEDENLKDILNTPLETFGSKEMEDLIDKYEKDE